MDIQNISGSDLMINKFSDNISIRNENIKPEEEHTTGIKNEPDENETKGRKIDISV